MPFDIKLRYFRYLIGESSAVTTLDSSATLTNCWYWFIRTITEANLTYRISCCIKIMLVWYWSISSVFPNLTKCCIGAFSVNLVVQSVAKNSFAKHLGKDGRFCISATFWVTISSLHVCLMNLYSETYFSSSSPGYITCIFHLSQQISL